VQRSNLSLAITSEPFTHKYFRHDILPKTEAAMQAVLTEVERTRVLAAVQAAEERTAGEIVPYVVARSGQYEIAVWRGAVMGAAVAMTLTLIVLQVYAGWGLGWAYTAWAMAGLMTLGGVIGAGLPATIPSVRRALAGKLRMAERVHRRAEAAYLEESVFDTRDRTGVLLFVSLFEHRIEVLADVGIHAAVPRDRWVDIVDLIRGFVADGRLADGLIAGIEECAELLERKGIGPEAEPADQLPGDVRLRTH
jgi:putative membrane protein